VAWIETGMAAWYIQDARPVFFDRSYNQLQTAGSRFVSFLRVYFYFLRNIRSPESKPETITEQ
jgi:hypothetical protein